MSIISLLNDLYLTSRQKPWKLIKPQVIQFPVNDICNSRCQMCNIWQQELDFQISPEMLKAAASNPLFSEVRGVGINGGEPTLRKDLSDLIEVLFSSFPKLKNISLITNSLNSKQVIKRIEEIGKVIRLHDGILDVMVSLDGVGEIHDKVRGRDRNFENSQKVIDFAIDSELVSSLRLGCTVIKDNVFNLHELLEFAIERDVYIKYRLGIPHQRLYSKDVIAPFSLSLEERYHFSVFLENLCSFYERSEQQRFFYKSLIGQLMYDYPRIAGCDWQHRGATITARGELLYCAVESKTLGSILTEDAEKLYFENQSHLTEIVNNKCSSCTHDYVGLPPTKVLLKLQFDKLKRKLKVDSLRFLPDNVYAFLKPIRSAKRKASFQKNLRKSGVNASSLSSLKPALTFRQNSVDKCKVLICGWYGTETLGDKAILGGVVSALRNSLGDFELYIASLERYITEVTISQMPELQGATIYTPSESLKATKNMDLVVFGGGPLMAIDSLAEMLAIFQAAAAAQIPTVIAGCGIGPLGFNHHNEAIKKILEISSFRIYRDEKSLSLARSFGIDVENDKVAEDPAFTWLNSTLSDSKDRQSRSLKNIKTYEDRPKLLLGLRDWNYAEYAIHRNPNELKLIKDRFEKELLLGLEKLLLHHPSLQIIPFPMCTNHIGGDDRWFYRRLFRTKPFLQKSINLDYLEAEISPSEALEVFRSSSIALTMRFHSLVFALACGIPCTSIDYTLGRGKVKSLAEKHSIPNMNLEFLDADFIFSSLTTNLEMTKSESYGSNHSILQSLEFGRSFELGISSFKGVM